MHWRRLLKPRTFGIHGEQCHLQKRCTYLRADNRALVERRQPVQRFILGCANRLLASFPNRIYPEGIPVRSRGLSAATPPDCFAVERLILGCANRMLPAFPGPF